MNSLKIKKQKENIKKKVFVGMSGGVDSSVSALLLKNAKDKKGDHLYEVIGVFIKVWTPDFIECTWREDRRDAMRVCAKLDIPFITLDLEKEYKERVIDYMINEYKKSRTPNPDVFCNKEVKFGAFYNWAMEQGADYIATGHYAQIGSITPDPYLLKLKREENAKSRMEAIKVLKKAKDESKDQIYFLWTLASEQLGKVLFPIGHLLKTEVRKIAEENDLVVAKKRDSQGLCFIGNINVKDFLKEYIKIKKGKVVLLESEEVKVREKTKSIKEGEKKIKKEVGVHEGVAFYTIGEKVSGYYVTAKDVEKNILYVSREKHSSEDLSTEVDSQDRSEFGEINLDQVNVSSEMQPGKTYEAQSRYHGPLTRIEVIKSKYLKSKKEFTFSYKINSNSTEDIIYVPGQSLVIYEKDKIVIAGIMK